MEAMPATLDDVEATAHAHGAKQHRKLPHHRQSHQEDRLARRVDLLDEPGLLEAPDQGEHPAGDRAQDPHQGPMQGGRHGSRGHGPGRGRLSVTHGRGRWRGRRRGSVLRGRLKSGRRLKRRRLAERRRGAGRPHRFPASSTERGSIRYLRAALQTKRHRDPPCSEANSTTWMGWVQDAGILKGVRRGNWSGAVSRRSWAS